MLAVCARIDKDRWNIRIEPGYDPSFVFPRNYRTAAILVVDDDSMVRDIVVEAIRFGGFEADACGDGAEALERNAAKNYDLIVTDMRLPSLDGLSLIKRLKASMSDTDVIVMTGYGSIENAVECMKAGAIEYLIKPFTVDQIQVAVKKAIEHRELRRRALEREFYRELSYVDALTGVHNRRYLDEALAAEVAKSLRLGSPFLLLMIDIDDFKIYNDRNGHPKGDEALSKIGKLLKSACRGYDIVARYGGEEFAIVFPALVWKTLRNWLEEYSTESVAKSSTAKVSSRPENSPYPSALVVSLSTPRMATI